MKFQALNLLIPVLLTACGVENAAGQCLTSAPETVYESTEMSPQNMDFDRDNNMFVAHPGWYNDKEVHYYKFRIFAPATYPGVISMDSGSDDVPIQKMYIVTTTGGFDGAIGKPVIPFHTADGLSYSDFMEVNFVTAPANYAADDYKSEEEIVNSGSTVTASGIVLNIPVVPTGSKLQHPVKRGTEMAPIDPIPVWYKCVEVHTYVFEVTDQSAADHFASTRTASPDPGFEIYVKPFATASSVSAIPLWHVNQFRNGVVEGEGGGPDPNGMRNIINLDRPDAGYSPLWKIFWVTELPVNYNANDVSNVAMMKAEYGFKVVPTPMYVNCPDIGPVNDDDSNPDMITDGQEFQTVVDPAMESNALLGSDMTLILKSEIPISIVAAESGDIIDTISTNMMGAYEYELMSADIPEGTMHINITANNATIRSLAVAEHEGGEESSTASTAHTLNFFLAASFWAFSVMTLL